MDEKDRIRIYGSSKKNLYIKELKRLNEAKISEKNKKLIQDFHNSLFSKGSGELRVAKVSTQLRLMCDILKKDLDKVEKKDFERVLAYYTRNNEYTFETKKDYKRAIKQFYHWFEDNDERLYSKNDLIRNNTKKFYKFIYGVRSNDPNTNKEIKEIIDENDITKVINEGTNSLKNRAFLKLLHETGMRCSEILSLRIKDVSFSEALAKVKVPPMKTGSRTIPIIHSVPYLHKWLEVHPLRNDNESFLFIGESLKHGKIPLTRNGVQKMINKCFDNAKVNKKHNLHWFRHSRSTILAVKVSEVLLCKYMGWVLGSRQVKRYVHLHGKELENAYCDIVGIKTTTTNENENKVKKCVCGKLNDSIAKYCYICGQALDVSTILNENDKTKNSRISEFDHELNNSISLLLEIAQDPKLMAMFEKFKRDIELNKNI